MNKYAIITHHDHNYQKLANYTWENNKVLYAKKHGYAYHAKTENWVSKAPNGGPSGFEKTYFIKELFSEHPEYEWLWWTGTDTLITNFAIKMEDRIDDRYHLILSADILGINNDSMLIRNSPEMINFLDKIIDMEEEYLKKYWDVEQRAIANLLGFPGTGEPGWPQGKDLTVKNEYKSFAKIMPQRFMNSFNYYIYPHYNNVPHFDKLKTDGNWRFGDWLIHWPATSLEYRIELAEFYNNEIVY